MKLLDDQNLSHRLVKELEVEFPGSVHARQCGLSTATDETLWSYAQANQLTIISKDADFLQRALLYGHPPQVIWLKVGNCSTEVICRMLRTHLLQIKFFEQDLSQALMILE